MNSHLQDALAAKLKVNPQFNLVDQDKEKLEREERLLESMRPRKKVTPDDYARLWKKINNNAKFT